MAVPVELMLAGAAKGPPGFRNCPITQLHPCEIAKRCAPPAPQLTRVFPGRESVEASGSVGWARVW